MDIKPANIMSDGRFVDFDSVIEVGNSREVPTTTPLYVAPEVLIESSITPYKRADEWSIGVMIYQFCYEKHPILSENHLDTFSVSDANKFIAGFASGSGHPINFEIMRGTIISRFSSRVQNKIKKILQGLLEFRADRRTSITDTLDSWDEFMETYVNDLNFGQSPGERQGGVGAAPDHLSTAGAKGSEDTLSIPFSTSSADFASFESRKSDEAEKGVASKGLSSTSVRRADSSSEEVKRSFVNIGKEEP